MAVLGMILLVFGGGLGDDEGPLFDEVAAAAGIDFRFHTGSRGRKDLPEIMGGGVALFDADGDGRLDIYWTNGGPIDPTDPDDPPCRLYLNRGDWRFEDVTATAGAPGPGYAMGCAVGDIDGDRRTDLVVTGWGGCRLYRNLGGGRFEDATAWAGLDGSGWATSAALADLDGDGDLDLYVCHYVEYDARRAPYCAAPDGQRDYCGPEVFAAEPDRLYRNDGRGRFHDVTEAAGLVDRTGRGLGVVVADFDEDGRADLFVANDGTPNSLFRNLGQMRFEEVAARAGVAVDGRGQVLAGMGAAVGDLDGDGRVDLLVANLLGRGTVGWLGMGRGVYVDASQQLGLYRATRDVTGFGLALADFDGDGDLDALQANGHVLDRERLGEPLAMRPLFLRNERGRLGIVQAGPWSDRPILGRGVAVGDLDGDGRPDAVVARLDGPALVLRNRALSRMTTVVAAPGAVMRATVAGQTTVHVIAGGGSYLAASAPAAYLALGQADTIDAIEVRWANGQRDEWRNLPAQTTIRLEPGLSDHACAQSVGSL
ncbi:MAG: RNA-binding protein [Isosphaeraceae bacterium]|nr:MAG: RNA-binding protein [Isosphaeraceae bacterium]